MEARPARPGRCCCSGRCAWDRRRAAGRSGSRGPPSRGPWGSRADRPGTGGWRRVRRAMPGTSVPARRTSFWCRRRAGRPRALRRRRRGSQRTPAAARWAAPPFASARRAHPCSRKPVAGSVICPGPCSRKSLADSTSENQSFSEVRERVGFLLPNVHQPHEPVIQGRRPTTSQTLAEVAEPVQRPYLGFEPVNVSGHGTSCRFLIEARRREKDQRSQSLETGPLTASP